MGYAPIELSIIINGKRCFINLPRKEKPEVYKRLIASKQTNQLKEYIALQMASINTAITDILSSGHILTSDTLRDYIQNGGIKLYTLSDLFTEYLSVLEQKDNLENYQKYIVLQNDFYSFIGDKNKPLVNITNADIRGFYGYLNKQYKASTAGGKLARLKCVFRYAYDNNKISINIFNGIKISKQKPSIEYLTEEEVHTLITKDFGIDRLNKVRDLFIFQCGSGLSYSDMAHLSPTDIQMDNGVAYIHKCRQKTNIDFTAVILGFAMDVLEKYNYSLPVLSNQKMNAYLGEIGILSGIGKRLHSHLGRKTYASYLLNKGVNISVVSKALGHANTLITQSTYAHMLTSTIVDSISSTVGI